MPVISRRGEGKKAGTRGKNVERGNAGVPHGYIGTLRECTWARHLFYNERKAKELDKASTRFSAKGSDIRFGVKKRLIKGAEMIYERTKENKPVLSLVKKMKGLW